MSRTGALTTEPGPGAGGGGALEFRPIFIVGAHRSGTTALAVMFDRHPRIAVPPETLFFSDFVKADRTKRLAKSHAGMLGRALADPRISEAGLRAEEVIDVFRGSEPTYAGLLRALLESYARKHGKQRCADKSCGHLFFVSELLHHYPAAKVICVLRDGRDVVRSLQKLVGRWGMSRRLPVLCRHWIQFARLGRRYLRELPSGSFTMVKYEDLMLCPERELRRLCEFVGEAFEPAQLCGGTTSGAVPAREVAWKGKARDGPDPSRVAAWRRCDDPDLIARMNFYMGRTLRDLGYPDTEVRGVPWIKRLEWSVRFLPCRRGVFFVTLRAKRVFRFVRSLFGLSDRVDSAGGEDAS